MNHPEKIENALFVWDNGENILTLKLAGDAGMDLEWLLQASVFEILRDAINATEKVSVDSWGWSTQRKLAKAGICIDDFNFDQARRFAMTAALNGWARTMLSFPKEQWVSVNKNHKLFTARAALPAQEGPPT